MRMQKIANQKSNNSHTQVVSSQQLSNNNINKVLCIASESDLVQTIIEVLVKKGMPRSIFTPEEIQKIARLHGAGATVSQFINGHNISQRCSREKGVSLNQLIEVVDSLVVKAMARSYVISKTNYRLRKKE